MVRIYATSSDPALQQELQLKLARKCLHACGISLFDLEKDLHIISETNALELTFMHAYNTYMQVKTNVIFVCSGTGFDEEAALIGAGREFALMKTATGKVNASLYTPQSVLNM